MSWLYLGYKYSTRYSVSSQSTTSKQNTSLESDSTLLSRENVIENSPSVAKSERKGIIDVNWTEDRVRQFYLDHKGESLKAIIAVLGEPRTQLNGKSSVYIKYVIDINVENRKSL